MIEPNRKVYDVGCDHGLLSIYLEKEKNCECIAIDKQEKCVKKTLENKKAFDSNIKVIRQNGLKKVEENSSVLLLGMGERTVQNILENIDFIPDSVYFYSQVNKNLLFFRKWLCKNQFKILDETIVFEKKQYYVIITFKKGKAKYSYKDFLLGPILRKKEKSITASYYQNELKKIEKRMADSKKIDQKFFLFFQKIVLKKQLC